MVWDLSNPAVLLMAYGSPETVDDIPAYLADIRHGRPIDPQIVEELKERYRKIGGRSPLLEITNNQAAALQNELKRHDVAARVYVGMKHWHPYIKEVVPEILKNGNDKLVALALTPHYSSISIGGYKRAIDEALTNRNPLRVDFIESWYKHPAFNQAISEKVRDAISRFPARAKINLIFTAHSLPERILASHDPYPNQLRESCEAVAKHLGINEWSFAYQSAGQTGEKWLGPDILELLENIGNQVKSANVLVVPIGFVADHLEILYDIDIEAQGFARDHGLTLRRTESLNAGPAFVLALSDIVRKRIAYTSGSVI